MRWIRLLLIFVVVIVLLLGAGTVFLLNLDPNDYKRHIEQFVVAETGRDFAIEGRIDLDLGADISLVVTDVRLGNPEWAANTDMVRAGRARVVLDLRSLWSGPVIVELVELDDTELNLEQQESGANNWTFGDGTDRDPLSLILRQATVNDFVLTVTVPALDQPLKMHVSRLDQIHGSDGLFDAKLHGTLNGRTIDLTGRYGSLQSLLAATNVSFDISGQFDTLQITATGVIDDLRRPRRPRVDIEVAGPDIDHVTQMLGLPDSGSGDLDLKVSLHPGRDDVAILVKGNIGEHRIDSAGSVSDLATFGKVSMRIAVHGPDLNKIARLSGWSNFPAGPYEIAGSFDRDGPRLKFDEIKMAFGEANLRLHGEMLQFPDFNDSTLDLDVRGERMSHFTRLFGLPGVIKGPFRATGKLEVATNGVQTFRFDATTQIAELAASGEISAGPGLAGTRAHVTGHGANIAAIVTAFGGTMPFVESFSFAGDIELAEKILLSTNSMTVTVGNNQLVATGTVGFDPLGPDTDLHVRAAGVDLAQVGMMAGITDGVPSVNYDVSSRLQISSDGYHVSDLKARIGDDVELFVDGLVSRQPRFAGTRLKIGASGSSFRSVLGDTGLWEPPDVPFEIQAQGRLDDGLLRVELATIELGDARVTANGVFDMPPDLSRTSLSISARTENLATIGRFDGQDLPGTDFRLDANFAGTLRSFSMDELTISSGDSDLTGSAVIHLDREIPDVKLRLHSKLLDLTSVIETGNDAQEVVDGDENASEKKPADGRLIPDWPLPLEQLQKFNAVVDIDISKYRQNQREFDNVVFDATLLDGRLDVERAAGETAYGSVSATLRVIPTDDAAMVSATFNGENMFLGDFTSSTREDMDAEPKYDIAIDLEGAGLTLRDIAANLNGMIKVSADEGRVPNSALNFLYGDFFGELFRAMNPFVKTDPYTNLSCVMIVAQIENGLLDARPGATVQTDKMNIISEGTIDLRTEKLNFNFKTAPRKKISISAGEFINPYVKVGGTMADPHLTLDPAGTLLSGGAAIATAGLSLLATAVWDRVFSAADPCSQVVERAEKKRQKENR